MHQIVCKHFLQVPRTRFDLSLTKSNPSNPKKTQNKTENNSKDFLSILQYNLQNEFYLRILITSDYTLLRGLFEGVLGKCLGDVCKVFWKYLEGILD